MWFIYRGQCFGIDEKGFYWYKLATLNDMIFFFLYILWYELIFFNVWVIGFTNNSCIIHGLDAYWPYSVVVHVIVEQFPEQNKTINITTLQSGNVVLKLFSFQLQIFFKNCIDLHFTYFNYSSWKSVTFFRNTGFKYNSKN